MKTQILTLTFLGAISLSSAIAADTKVHTLCGQVSTVQTRCTGIHRPCPVLFSIANESLQDNPNSEVPLTPATEEVKEQLKQLSDNDRVCVSGLYETNQRDSLRVIYIQE